MSLFSCAHLRVTGAVGCESGELVGLTSGLEDVFSGVAVLVGDFSRHETESRMTAPSDRVRCCDNFMMG